MAYQQTYEGTPAELAEQLRLLPDTQKYQMTLTSEETAEGDTETLETAIAKMTSRTPEEIAAARERLLAASPQPRELPMGQTIFDAVMGKWPGDETDEQIFEALERLS
jgi:hypothetical protein